MKMKKIISFASIFCFLLQVLLYPLPAWGEEKMTTLEKGEAAPYAGTLFSTEAAAKLVTQLEFNQSVCDAEKEKALEMQKADLQLKIDLCEASLTSCKSLCETRLEIKNEQITFLQDELTQRKHMSPTWVFVTGVLAGGLIAVGSAYGYSAIASR